MSIEPPAGGVPRRSGPRDPGDAWVVADDGSRYWGRFGAAGLLAVDARRGVLLQHRVSWSHFGDTWALPGGARHEHESARVAALREAGEEAGVPGDAVAFVAESVLDVGVWTYTTVVAEVVRPFEPVISDPESHALAWVPPADVDALPLHPAFAEAWPTLRATLGVRPAVVVDVANVMGATPDGWWRDRAGAGGRLLARLAAFAPVGVDAAEWELAGTRWFPRIVAVTEGETRAARDVRGIDVVRAPGSGDDEIVGQAGALVDAGSPTVVVTSDRGLADRVRARGAAVRGAGWLIDQLG